MDTKRLARATVVVALGAALFGGPLDGRALSQDLAGALALLALVTLGAALVALPDGALESAAGSRGSRRSRLRPRVFLLGGSLAAGAFALDARVWIGLLFTATVASLVVPASFPSSASPSASSPAPPAFERLLFFVGALSLPVLFAVAAAVTGNGATFVHDLARALPTRPLAVAARVALETALVLYAAGAARPSWLARALVAAAGVALALRVAHVALLVSLPSEVYWPEAPFLVDALKLDAGETLYGPPALLDSYTYSPLVDLLHHALLSPLGAELSLHANRAVVLGEEALAIALLAFSLRRALGRALLPALLVALAALGNPLAPAVHPDHALLLLFALAASLLVAESAWPRAAFLAALFFVTPIAFAVKLSGAGLGVGLFAVFLVERRRTEVLVLAASGALALATIPLFDATLGSFSFYAIRVQASHPIVWSRLVELPLTPAGAAALFAGWLTVRAARAKGTGEDREASRPLLRVAALTFATSLASLPAYLKYGGRENNVSLLVVGSALILVLAGGRATRDAASAKGGFVSTVSSLASLAALVFAVLFEPRLPSDVLADRAAAVAEAAHLVDTVASDRAAGRTTLLLVHTSAWIRAGRRDVPHDRLHSAVELFYGGFPEADLLFSHIESGRYDTVIATGDGLRAAGGPLGRFATRLRESLHDYAAVWPDDPQATDGVIVFRRTVASLPP